MRGPSLGQKIRKLSTPRGVNRVVVLTTTTRIYWRWCASTVLPHRLSSPGIITPTQFFLQFSRVGTGLQVTGAMAWRMLSLALFANKVAAAPPQEGVVFLLSYSVYANATLSTMDTYCQNEAGSTFQAFVCSEQREWSVLDNVPLYTKAGYVGTFPTLSSPITTTAGSLPASQNVFTGCDQRGVSLALEETCSNWRVANGALAAGVGRTGVSSSWLQSTTTDCINPAPIYCISIGLPSVIWASASLALPPHTISALDKVCRDEDYSLPRTYALVCQPKMDWLATFKGGSIPLHKRSGASLGDKSLTDFSLANPIMDGSGKVPSSSLLTGCNGTLMYEDPRTSCRDWDAGATADDVAYVATPGATSAWINNKGQTAACDGSYQIICVRLASALAPTPPPTTPPTAPTTHEPTPVPGSPTRIPTTRIPTTRTPTTKGASLPTPLSKGTASPTLTPDRSILRPTPRPTSSSPKIVVTNFTGNVTQNVTVPGDGANVTVILPAALFQYGNSNSSVVISKGSLKDFVAAELVGGDSVVSIDVIVDGQPVDVMDLAIPVEFVIPRPVAACEAQLAAPAKCVWWDETDFVWRTDNCTTTSVTLPGGAPGTRCTCNHLTDFAVLLDRSTTSCVQANEGYLVFAALYAMLVLYCLIVVARLQMLRERATRFLRSQHTAIGAAALVRMLSCLSFYGLFMEDLVLEGFLTALPYLIELWIFTRMASTWLGLVEFTMLSSEVRWEKIRPWLYAINVIGSLFVIALFAAFLIELDATTALVGTIGIATVYTILAATFLYYSSRLVTTMSPGSTMKRTNTSSAGTKRVGLCSPTTKILIAGRGSALCFIVQAVSSVLALVLERALIAPFTIIFLAFNCLALIGILMIYQGAVVKGFRPKIDTYASESSQRSVEITKDPSMSR